MTEQRDDLLDLVENEEYNRPSLSRAAERIEKCESDEEAIKTASEWAYNRTRYEAFRGYCDMDAANFVMNLVNLHEKSGGLFCCQSALAKGLVEHKLLKGLMTRSAAMSAYAE